eukprot:GILJ01003419.1.p1 GENE.GILJ01003419.1~~GILJ01003419.1.p1  ORF type:complete len:847 (+),score=152.98 GILJ01003419.1:62-2542(+)
MSSSPEGISSVQDGYTQKSLRCRKFASSPEGIPKSYTQNTAKEELVLEHVEEFERQFGRVYGYGRELLIRPKNECNVTKFICTTIRPTQLAFLDLYSYKSCSKFLADFLTYETLEPPTKFPAFIPSPSSVLEWQAGDCFDFAIALCSLLVGCGYDAYCVTGKAPLYITKRDQTKMECPYVNGDAETPSSYVPHQPKPSVERSDFVIPKRANLVSAFQTKVQLEEKHKAENAAKQATVEEDDYVEFEPVDPLHGQRLHAWVLLRAGKREISEPMFVEPSTGVSYPIEKAPYLQIDAVWNHQNYWVNVQNNKKVSDLSFDFSDSHNWEYVMLEGLGSRKSDDHGDGEQEDDDIIHENEKNAHEDQLLDMPPSWSRKLAVDRDAYQLKCPSGEKTILYKKAKVDRYAEHMQIDGLVLRVTLYRDIRRTIPKEIREYYSRRKDKLLRRFRFPTEGIVLEQFDEGRPSHLKELIEVEGQKREMKFYTSRLDGLVRREDVIGQKIVEEFQSRDDHLIYRSVSMVQGNRNAGSKQYTIQSGSLGDLAIRKMTQKFSRNKDKDADKDIAKLTFYVSEGSIRIDYHYNEGSITAAVTRYSKDGSNALVKQSNPFAPEPQESIVYETQLKMMQQEKDCYMQIRDAEREAVEEMQNRRREEETIANARAMSQPAGSQNPLLEKTIYDIAREKAKEGSQKKQEEDEAGEEAAGVVDYLSPFLAQYGNRKLNKAEALAAKDSCLSALKDRLLERANIIQKRLEEENSLLAKKQLAFSRRGDNVDKAEEEEHERYFTEAMFRIKILEQRLARHEETALQKYAELDAKLRNDPRLVATLQR